MYRPINATTQMPNFDNSEIYVEKPPTLCENFPSYFSIYAVLLLITTSVLMRYSHIKKMVLMTIIAGKNSVIVLMFGMCSPNPIIYFKHRIFT